MDDRPDLETMLERAPEQSLGREVAHATRNALEGYAQDRELVEFFSETRGGSGAPVYPNVALLDASSRDAVGAFAIENAESLYETLLEVEGRRMNETRLAHELHQAKKESRTDPLTGLPNRRAFVDEAERFYSRANREGASVSVLYLDIDHFKNVNDTYGHDVGDVALSRFAHMLGSGLRGGDFAARLGGEEFAVMLYNEGHPNQAAERIRARVERESKGVLSASEPDIGYTVSIGTSTYRGEEETPFNAPAVRAAQMKRADESVYVAKNTGRNRVVDYDDVTNVP